MFQVGKLGFGSRIAAMPLQPKRNIPRLTFRVEGLRPYSKTIRLRLIRKSLLRDPALLDVWEGVIEAMAALLDEQQGLNSCLRCRRLKVFCKFFWCLLQRCIGPRTYTMFFCRQVLVWLGISGRRKHRGP